jgi:hypothetical protein
MIELPEAERRPDESTKPAHGDIMIVGGNPANLRLLEDMLIG